MDDDCNGQETISVEFILQPSNVACALTRTQIYLRKTNEHLALELVRSLFAFFLSNQYFQHRQQNCITANWMIRCSLAVPTLCNYYTYIL